MCVCVFPACFYTTVWYVQYAHRCVCVCVSGAGLCVLCVSRPMCVYVCYSVGLYVSISARFFWLCPKGSLCMYFHLPRPSSVRWVPVRHLLHRCTALASVASPLNTDLQSANLSVASGAVQPSITCVGAFEGSARLRSSTTPQRQQQTASSGSWGTYSIFPSCAANLMVPVSLRDHVNPRVLRLEDKATGSTWGRRREH